jgi:predicted MPP superfamily phosphohydrolase
VAIRSPRWPNSWRPFRIGLLSDSHTGGPLDPPERLAQAVDAVNAAAPDVVLLLGDYIEPRRPRRAWTRPETVAAILARLRAPFGVFAVLGNHDMRLPGVPIRSALENVGIPVLINAARRLSDNEIEFWLVGTGDRYRGMDDLDRALAQVTDDAPSILMTHSPDLFPEVPDRVALTVAGHTHGGQIRLPLIGAPVIPSDHGTRYIYGHVIEHGRHLFVTRGLGHSTLPLRIGAPSEVVVVTLTGEDA